MVSHCILLDSCVMIIVPQLTGQNMKNNRHSLSPGPRRCPAPRSTADGATGPGGSVRRARERPTRPAALRAKPGPRHRSLDSGRNVKMYNVFLLLRDETNFKTKNV